MTVMRNRNLFSLEDAPFYFRLKDPVSALTHIGGFVFAIIGMPLLLIKGSADMKSITDLISFAIFMMSMIILYGASSAYHSFNISEKGNLILKKIDHMSISILISGSYVPVCIAGLENGKGTVLLGVIYTFALLGILFKLFYVKCPKWVSSVIYLGMGWACIMMLPELLNALAPGAFAWLLAGGVFYSVGAVIYALKPNLFHNKWFGNHELFHCFVLAGSFCHYMMVFQYFA